jgi:hypothetical protein
MNPTPQALYRIHDASTGPLRRYDLEKHRSQQRTNAIWREAQAPQDAALQAFADALLAAASETHTVESCRVSSRWITLEFPDCRKPGNLCPAYGEISIYLPRSRDDIHPFHKQKWVRGFPFVTLRAPTNHDKARCYQLSPRATPAMIWARYSHLFAAHAKTSHSQAA